MSRTKKKRTEDDSDEEKEEEEETLQLYCWACEKDKMKIDFRPVQRSSMGIRTTIATSV